MKPKREHIARYVILAVVFIVACLFYLGKLVNYQIAGQDYYTMARASRTYTRTVPVRALRGQIAENGYGTRLSVDGGVNAANASLLLEAGADILICGSSAFQNDAVEENIARLLRAGGA